MERSKSEVTGDEYDELYEALTDNLEKHLSVKHFRTGIDVSLKFFFCFNIRFL
jgi:HSP90 family molecular chaperone